MNNLSLAKTKTLTYAGTADDLVQSTVAASGNRVCLRAFGLMEYPSSILEYITEASFKDGGGTEVFSCYVPLYAALSPYFDYGLGTPMILIEIPGEGVLFDDGLIIELKEVTDRVAAMRTVLQVVYT